MADDEVETGKLLVVDPDVLPCMVDVVRPKVVDKVVGPLVVPAVVVVL